MPRIAVALTFMIGAAIGWFGLPVAFAATPAQTPAGTPADIPADIAACYGGDCSLTVTGPVEIPLDGRAGVTALSVADIGPNAVTFTARRNPGVTFAAVGAGATIRFSNGSATLAVHVAELTGGTARLELRTTTAIPGPAAP